MGLPLGKIPFVLPMGAAPVEKDRDGPIGFSVTVAYDPLPRNALIPVIRAEMGGGQGGSGPGAVLLAGEEDRRVLLRFVAESAGEGVAQELHSPRRGGGRRQNGRGIHFHRHGAQTHGGFPRFRALAHPEKMFPFLQSVHGQKLRIHFDRRGQQGAAVHRQIEVGRHIRLYLGGKGVNGNAGSPETEGKSRVGPFGLQLRHP